MSPEREAAATGPAVPAEDVIDLREYLRVLARRRGVVVLCALLAVLTAGLLSFFVLPPVYEARTVLLVTQATEKVQAPVTGREGESVITTLTRLPALTMNTYVGQLKSETVAERTIKKLGLDPNLYTPVTLARMVTATAQKDSNLIELKVRHQDPLLAARIANTMAEELLGLISEKNQEQMARSVQFLVDQRRATEKELQKAVEELGKFDSEPRSVAFLEEQFKALTAELTRAQADLNKVTVEAEQLRAGLARLEADLADTPRMVKVTRLDPTTGRTLEGEDVNPVYVNLAEEVAKKRASLGEKEAQLSALQSLRVALTEELATLQGELTAKKARRDQLAAEVKRLEETLQATGDDLSGRWQVAIEPGGLKGTFDLRLFGTLVSGVYELAGGWKGSLRGTLVGNTVRLERIDSQLGFVAVYTGRLEVRGAERRIEGTWQATNLAAGLPSAGTWLAQREAKK